MKKWEYKVVYSLEEIEANKLGEEGWELLTFKSSKPGADEFAWFKREK